MKRISILYSISIVLIFLAVRPSFTPLIIGTADGIAHKYRLINFHESLSEGVVRPRWVGKAVLGYGAPLFVFNYSVPYYLVDLLYRAGFSLQTASQLYMALTLITACFAMYLFTSHLWGPWSGMVASFVYMYAPYHLHTMYSYEAWGEMLAFVYPPLLLYFLYRSWDKAAVITWVLFILSHNISSYIATPAIILLAITLGKKPRYLLSILFFVGMLTAFFTLPAITLSKTLHMTELFTKEMLMRTAYMSPLFQQIRISFNAILGTPIVYQAFTIGIPILLSVGIGIISIRKKIPALIIGTLGIFVFSIFLTTPASDILYRFHPLQYVLYPYRFLFVATFTGSMIAGYVVRKSWIAGSLLILLSFVFGYPYTHPTLDTFDFPQTFYTQPQVFRYAYPTQKNMGIEEFVPKTASRDFLFSEEKKYIETQKLPEKFILSNGNGTVLSQTVHQESLTAMIDSDVTTKLTVSTLFYPGWGAKIDNKKTIISHDNVGRITVMIPEGTHAVSLHYGFSIIEQIGLVISGAGLLLFIATLIRSKK